MEHDNVEQVIDENRHRGRPKIRFTAEEEREFRERQRVLRNERVRRFKKRCNNNSNTLEPNNNQVNLTEKSRQCRWRCRSRENDEEEREFQNRRREWNVENQRFLEQNSNIDEYYLGEMDVLCSHCNAKHFTAEKVFNKGNSFNDYSGHGTVKLEAIPDFPDNLRSLFENNHQKSKVFFERIRNYNSSFSFASFNAKVVDMPTIGRAAYCFKIQGQIYYQINEALYPSENDYPKYGQLFIVDPQEAIDYNRRAIFEANRYIYLGWGTNGSALRIRNHE